MPRARSPGLTSRELAAFARRTAARCSSTRSARCRWHCKRSCCVSSRKARSSRSGRQAAIGRRPPRRCHNRNLGELAAEGKFRSDLYYRLNVVPLGLPPLRDRREDVGTLAGHFLRGTGRKFNAEAMASLERYPWPATSARWKRGRAAQGIETGRGLPTSGSAAGDPRRAAAARNPQNAATASTSMQRWGPGGPPDPGGPRAEWRKQEPGREVSRPQPHHVGREAAEDVPALSSREITFRVLSR